MLKGHFTSAGASIEYGDAEVLFPVDDLDATVLQHRDAQLALADADGSAVVVVAPTSLATSYALTQHPLTAIAVDSLPDTVRAELADALDTSLEAFELVQIGKWSTDSPNRSLTEFTDSR
ncbi:MULTISPECIES: hypothetical protein [Haloferax]|uniref:DUF8165 domain-containing protein n=1 Tax=Haloferax marinum TaxID=2666143 RepID=A0A6A8GAP1_9EURY|nr:MULTISPECIES: hypothetical protein [Haloferax]KAB1198559.1 hypothetical protein Hfx1150_13960 [Haloferax sp. CBA1150]MRW97668.1 hypothetical protein [Haloferax marinum]